METFNINISAQDIIAQRERNEMKNTQNVFDARNYLQTKLAPNETSKEMTIRLLPFDKNGGEVFHEVYFHQVRVNEKISPSGWKSYPCPIKNHLGDKCPICELAAEANKLKNASIDETTKNAYKEMVKNNLPRKMYIVRCIERGKEEDGVKFWKFSHSLKGDGVYDKIYSIFKMRLAKSQAKGEEYNIFDLNNGKDLNLVITKDSQNRTVININDDEDKTPLSTDFNKAMGWINDEKEWTNVYAVKPYDFMSIIVAGGIPTYDKEKQTYVDLNEMEKEKQLKMDKEALKQDTSKFESVQMTNDVTDFFNNSNDNDLSVITDDDLPF